MIKISKVQTITTHKGLQPIIQHLIPDNIHSISKMHNISNNFNSIRSINKIHNTSNNFNSIRSIHTSNINNLHKHSKHKVRSEEHTSELQSRGHLVCRL